MTLKDICTSQELSKKLAEAGVPQEGGIRYWCYNDKNNEWEFISSYQLEVAKTWCYVLKYYKTFTFNELWEMLPLIINTPREYTKTFIDTGESPFQFRIIYWNEPNAEPLFVEIGNTPQETTGKLLLWCIEQGYVSPKEK